MADKKDPLQPDLWTARTVEDTIALYAEWSESYDADLSAHGYHTPARIAAALVAKLNCGNLLALSYSDPTLADPSYTDALGEEIGSGRAEVIFREQGPHLDDVSMGADIIILRRR